LQLSIFHPFTMLSQDNALIRLAFAPMCSLHVPPANDQPSPSLKTVRCVCRNPTGLESKSCSSFEHPSPALVLRGASALARGAGARWHLSYLRQRGRDQSWLSDLSQCER
jgi:hypothetical protein